MTQKKNDAFEVSRGRASNSMLWNAYNNEKEHNMKRHSSAVWQGTLKEGKGTLTTQSGVLQETPYSFTGRFESGTGTNPEELIAAAHAGCFTMSVSAKVSAAGFNPERLSTRANLTLEQVQGAWTITTIHLELTAKVPGIERTKFDEIAADAMNTCIISRALKADFTLHITFEN